MMMTLKHFVFLFLFLGGHISVMARGEMNEIIDVFSREELVHMAGYGENKLSTIIITGQVHCHAIMDERPVSGATVGVLCSNSEGKKRKSWVKGKTDVYGEFSIDLPSHLHAIPNLEKKCHLKLLHMPKKSLCRTSPSFAGKHMKDIKLSSVHDGIRVYTAQKINLISKISKIRQAKTKRHHILPTRLTKVRELVSAK